MRFGRQMYDSVRLIQAEYLRERRAIADVCLLERVSRAISDLSE